MKGLHVGIIGAGRSGISAAKFLSRLGANVLLSEKGKVEAVLPARVTLETGQHSDRLLACDLIVRSPGVPNHLPILAKVIRREIPIWSELELGSRYARSKQLIAITGTNGKTTTTTLVGQFFKNAGRPTFVAGNIGRPLTDIASKTTKESVIILEVSSYQLEDIHSFHPTISAILNITPDHLEHHGSMKAYIAAKAKIFENQTKNDVCVLNADDAACRRLSAHCAAEVLFFSRTKVLKFGIWMEDGDMVIRWKSLRARWRLESHLPGPHNIENILAAVAIAAVGGVKIPVIRRVLSRFQGVEHRLELVRTLRGVRYINDSKGTNVDSTRVALASFSEPLIVILGGEGKGAPYAPLKALLRRNAKTALLIGEDAPIIEKELRGVVPMERCSLLKKAILRAQKIAHSGDVVLLSPACASFDQYANYEERGREFKALVRSLK